MVDENAEKSQSFKKLLVPLVSNLLQSINWLAYLGWRWAEDYQA
jgi:hypothetical protein